MRVRRVSASRRKTCSCVVFSVAVCFIIISLKNVHVLPVPGRIIPVTNLRWSRKAENDGNAISFENDYVTVSYQSDEISTSADAESNVLVTGNPGLRGHEKIIDKPLILVWNARQTPLSPIPDVHTCGGGCQISNDRTKIHESSAIVFDMKGFLREDIPDQHSRDGKQVYVWWSEDSPWMSKHMYNRGTTKQKTYDKNFFNWTMTYKPSSDVNAMMIPYTAIDFVIQRMNGNRMGGDFYKRFGDSLMRPSKSLNAIADLQMRAKKVFRKKSKMAIWISSNCGYTAAAVLRRKIVTELQFLGLKVDVFGRCGEMNVPDDLSGFLRLISQYKFTLAFENALHCRSYISEKFWYNGLYAGTIPVVWGPIRSDLEAIAPDGSYIFYEDFNSSQSLVDYLHYVGEDRTKYIEYLSWWWESPGTFPVYGVTEFHNDLKGRRASFDFEMNAFCNLCNLLNKQIHLKTNKSIQSLQDWWYTDESITCLDRFHGVKIDRYGVSPEGAYEVFKYG